MISGYSIVNGESNQAAGKAGKTFTGFDPAAGAPLAPEFYSAPPEVLNRAADLAEEAFVAYGNLPGTDKAVFLRRIASGIESIAEELVERAHRETALPEARLKGELARTANQLRLLAQVAEEGSWVSARIDPAQAGRKPLPRADIRSVLRPLGPIAVFGSSNFPLAFSVAGGDTASVLAAGCPVIVKAHPAHPGTSELVGRVIAESARELGLHPGVFALLFDSGIEIGSALVRHPKIRAVGFTGSLNGGRALMDLCARRPEPIPCFTEMSSVNPLFVLPEALTERAAQISAGLFASFTLGVGQFCTKPGLVFLPANAGADVLVAELKRLVDEASHAPMLTEGIAKNYQSGLARRVGTSAVSALAESKMPNHLKNCAAAPALFEISGKDFLTNLDLSHEIFGPATLLIRCESREQMLALAGGLEGQLTATLHGTEADLARHRDLIAILERKAGRLIVNGYPTGVEVCHAMVHGGPYPATSDSRFTSVGTQAIYRWARPVCYQDFPQAALPAELKDENPLGILRMIDGAVTREGITH